MRRTKKPFAAVSVYSEVWLWNSLRYTENYVPLALKDAGGQRKLSSITQLNRIYRKRKVDYTYCYTVAALTTACGDHRLYTATTNRSSKTYNLILLVWNFVHGREEAYTAGVWKKGGGGGIFALGGKSNERLKKITSYTDQRLTFTFYVIQVIKNH
jgi:hypothetical protein